MVDVQKRVSNRLLPKKNLFWSKTMLTKRSLCPNLISSLKSRVLDIVVDMVKRDVKNGVTHRLMPKKNLFWLMTMSTKESLYLNPISSLKQMTDGSIVVVRIDLVSAPKCVRKHSPKKNLFWSMTLLAKRSLCPNPISSLKSRDLVIV